MCRASSKAAARRWPSEINKLVIPLEDKKTPAKTAWPGGFMPDDVKDFEPGVAIVLNQLDPPLTPAQISDRIRQQQLQLPPGNPGARRWISRLSRPRITPKPQPALAVILCRNDRIALFARTRPNGRNRWPARCGNW